MSKNDTVAAALEIMAKNNIVSVPVRDDSAGRFIGMFDTLDLVALSLSVASDKDPQQQFFSTPVGKVISTCPPPRRGLPLPSPPLQTSARWTCSRP